jgi:hypothetical protein
LKVLEKQGIGTMPRELIEPHKGDKRYIRRAPNGQFTEKQVDVGRSLAADRRSKSKTVAKKGEGDRGDQKRR